ncbi:MAG: decaprenyl-phosphate phosphoribosyltransferase [Actinomycetes bacterium]
MQPATAARDNVPFHRLDGGATSRGDGPPHVPDAAARRLLPQRVRLLLALSRPRQWTKSVLVLAAPAAAGTLNQAGAAGRTAATVLAFTLASVAVYAANDVRDAAADRAHPHKRLRPVASGALSATTALVWAGTCALVSLTAAAVIGSSTFVVVVCYLALSGGYALWLKNMPVLDVVAVAAGFVLRALAGATANHLVPSDWFLLVSLFGALYLVLGKRASEATHPTSTTGGSTAGASSGPATPELPSRAVLSQYPTAWLQQMLTVSLAGALLSYAMWAFQTVGTDVFKPLLALSVVPFIVALMRYGLLLAGGQGERPEHVVTSDRMLMLAGLAWCALVTGGLYAA